MNWAQTLESRQKWDRRFIQLAYCVRLWSKDSRPVGAILVDQRRRVIGEGYNGFPPGISDTKARLEDQDLKRSLMVHAEVNALLNAVSDTHGSTLYSTRYPCHTCATVIAQKGVMRVVSPAPNLKHDTWGASTQLAMDIFKEAGIEWTEQA